MDHYESFDRLVHLTHSENCRFILALFLFAFLLFLLVLFLVALLVLGPLLAHRSLAVPCMIGILLLEVDGLVLRQCPNELDWFQGLCGLLKDSPLR